MKRLAWFAAIFSFHASFAEAAPAGLTARDLAGWWSANPSWGGESSPIAIQFLEKDGKQIATASIPAIAVYDVPLGEVTITGHSLETRSVRFPLTWNAEKQTLSGFITAEAVPVYQIPVEFKRGEPLVKPTWSEWQAPRPEVVWSVDTGGSPVWAGIERADDGTLYIGNENGDVSAIDRHGKPRWKFATGKPVRSQPKVMGEHVFIASDSGFLHKLVRASGVEVWRARVDAGAPARIPTDAKGTRWDRYGSSIVADESTAYFASRDKHLYAIDLETGRERWRLEAGDLMTATPAIHKESVIFAAFDGKVQAVRSRDGKPLWTYDAKLAVPGDVVVADGRVLVGSRSYDLIALDAATGRELWKRYYWFSWIESPPLVRDGVIYTGSSDATNVYAIDLADGTVRWKTAVPGWSWQRTAVTDDLVIAGTVGAGAYPGRRSGSLVALDRRSGAVRWIHLDAPSDATAKANRSWGFGASPAAAEGMVYAADLEGRLFALKP